jgi:hypothetical protein
MPTRRYATATERSAPSRAVVKKSAPVGPDCALVLSAASRPAMTLSYWDLCLFQCFLYHTLCSWAVAILRHNTCEEWFF